MKRIAVFALVIAAAASFTLALDAQQVDSTPKACGANKDGAACAKSADGCAKKAACGGEDAKKCCGSAACEEAKKACKDDCTKACCADGAKGAQAAADCSACAPMASVAGTEGSVRMDFVRLSNGTAMVVTTTDTTKVADLQAAASRVHGSLAEAAKAGGADGLCGLCDQLVALTKSGSAQARAEKLSTGVLFLLTSDQQDTVRDIQAWANGMQKAQVSASVRPVAAQAG